MTRQSKIVSFDDVQRASRSRSRAQNAAAGKSAGRTATGKKRAQASSSTRHDERYERSAIGAYSNGQISAYDLDNSPFAYPGTSSSATNSRSQSARVAHSKSASRSAHGSGAVKSSKAKGANASKAKGSRGASQKKHSGASAKSAMQMIEGAVGFVSGKTLTAAQQRKRDRVKAKADKMFEKTFLPKQLVDDSAPRAALYKGEASAKQRRSARMQKASEAGSSSAKINPAGWFANLHISAAHARIATAAICLVMVFAFLYGPTQHFYQAQRENDRLQAEYAAIEQRNIALDAQNDSLGSDAGMEDAVRQKYGYIVEGEETARVTGLSDEARTNVAGDGIYANVLSSKVKAPEYWYTPFLDAFFGVD